jgi:D-tagatose-1,6-bisphosphate aldolase subunit GatZ/KbaZ
MENEPTGERSNLLETVVGAMKEDDRYWKSYYQGSLAEVAIAIRYSFSDRIRYYWATEAAGAAFSRLIANLESREIPLTLLSQYLPLEYRRVRDGAIPATPRDLILSHIMETTATYSKACSQV